MLMLSLNSKNPANFEAPNVSWRLEHWRPSWLRQHQLLRIARVAQDSAPARHLQDARHRMLEDSHVFSGFLKMKDD